MVGGRRWVLCAGHGEPEMTTGMRKGAPGSLGETVPGFGGQELWPKTGQACKQSWELKCGNKERERHRRSRDCAVKLAGMTGRGTGREEEGPFGKDSFTEDGGFQGEGADFLMA